MSELEQALRSVGRELEMPDAPDLAASVLARIGTQRPAPRRRRVVLALAAVAIAALLATLAIPEARSALLRFLRIGGERIEFVDELPVIASPPELGLTLGQRVPLSEARLRAGADLLELAEAPDAVYIGERDTVWFLYGRPDAVRLLVSQTPKVAIDEPFILKKLVSAGTWVESATVRDHPAYFLSGEPHVVLLIDENGVSYPESARLAGNVLVWEQAGRTIRLEGDMSRAEALRVAESLR